MLFKLKEAIQEKSESKILMIMRRVGDAFPDQLNEAVINEMEPLIKTIEKLSETLSDSESKTRAVKVIDLWWKKIDVGNSKNVLSQRQMMDEKIRELKNSGEKNKFEENKKPMNFIDATRSVPGKSRRK